jgi:hypothetical protein
MARSSGFLDGVTNALSGSALRQAQALDLYSPTPLTTAAGVRYTNGTDYAVAFSSGLNFTIQPGSAITGSTTSSNAGYPHVSTAIETRATTAANASNPRIDLLYAYVLDDGSGTVDFEWLQGTPAPSPVAPTITRANYCLLYQLNVPAGIGSNLATATLTDKRVWLAQAYNPQGIRALGAGCNATQGLTTSPVDIPGCSITFQTYRANVQVMAFSVFDFSWAGTTFKELDGFLNVDGTLQTARAQWVAAMSGGDRKHVPQNWTVTLASAGTHTIKLQADINAAGASGTFNVNTPGTTINLLVLD